MERSTAEDSGSWRDLLTYYCVWSVALIGTCQVFGRPSGIALTSVEVMDIRKSAHCDRGGLGDKTGKRYTEERRIVLQGHNIQPLSAELWTLLNKPKGNSEIQLTKWCSTFGPA